VSSEKNKYEREFIWITEFEKEIRGKSEERQVGLQVGDKE
jgi:hypothetical protein